MYSILLIALTVLAIGSGLAAEWLIPDAAEGFPGWAIAGLLAVIAIAVASMIRERLSATRLHRLAGELETTRLDLDGVRKELAGIRDQIDAIPDTSAVVAEIRVLQGLMGQFTDKRGASNPEHADGTQPARVEATPPAINAQGT